MPLIQYFNIFSTTIVVRPFYAFTSVFFGNWYGIDLGKSG